MSKGLSPKEALEKLRQNYKDDAHLFDDELLDIIETALNRLEELEKVLKIIKKKGVNVSLLHNMRSHISYNIIVTDRIRALTETEFDLLKEYLK